MSVDIENVISNDLKINTADAYKWVKSKTWEDIVNIYLNLWKIKFTLGGENN